MILLKKGLLNRIRIMARFVAMKRRGGGLRHWFNFKNIKYYLSFRLTIQQVFSIDLKPGKYKSWKLNLIFRKLSKLFPFEYKIRVYEPLLYPGAIICKLRANSYQNWIQRLLKPIKRRSYRILRYLHSEVPYLVQIPHFAIWGQKITKNKFSDPSNLWNDV